MSISDRLRKLESRHPKRDIIIPVFTDPGDTQEQQAAKEAQAVKEWEEKNGQKLPEDRVIFLRVTYS
jgi:hypothetical protein